ncbi:hypothetical protein KXJ69_08360 [Aureisphaera sp. CAU 1614]|uniref:Cytochrome c domain-containing protein n=1 Tax=Halomarinibacterium sedimenti TaxID=2857106 RepID=A0A9X1JZ22_9FLAO|nr:hypothetical protein [Halomarinibacterium sedimenti]MBW2938117.1 hypothetical protein [Halomarinibacterium sedimenti]
MKLKVIIFSITLLGISSCSTNTLDDVMEPVQETPELTTFQDVKSIFENNCLQCHSNPPQNGAPMPLVTFENVRDAVISRGLLDRISRNEGESGLMPLGGPRLPQTTINLIVSWEEDGLLEN